MYNMGLSAASKLAYEALLVSHHTLEIQVILLDMSHNQLSVVSNRFIDGQVTIDAGAEVTRGLSLDLSDPLGALHLDSNSPDQGAMFADRMIQVRHSIINPMGTARYTCPIFTGPINKLDRNGYVVRVECQGKESLGMSPAWTAKTYKKGYKVTAAIYDVLLNIIGENKLVIPDLAYKFPRNWSVGGDKIPWPTAKAMAASIGYQLYYDGAGVARLRKVVATRMFTFRENAGGTVKTQPNVGFNIDGVINAVEVWGKKPEKPKKGKKPKKQPHYKVVAARSHPLSPWSLGGNGGAGQRKPRYMPMVVEDDAIVTDAQAKARATAELNRRLLESVTVGFDALVIPHLEELDVVRLATEKYATDYRMTQFAIPLTSAASMPVGYVKNVKPNKSEIRRVRTTARKVS